MYSKDTQAVIYAYEKGYRIKNNEVISPFSSKPRKQNFNIDKRNGYSRARFSVRISSGESYPVFVHKLLAYQKFGLAAFEDGIEIRHLDGDSTNNTEDNIIIGTKQENELDKPSELRLKSSINASKNIRAFTDSEMEDIRLFHNGSYKETMETFGVCRGTLHRILNVKYKTRV